MNLRIKGVIVPLLTPFDEHGMLDCNATMQLVEFLIEQNVHGLFPGGTTGEGPLLSIEERRLLAETVVKAADRQVPVIVHTGAITTRETIELTRHAQECGASGAAIIAPYFFRLTDDALFEHFAQVCAAVPDFPIYLYNNPAGSGNAISAELVARLVDACPNVIGIKDSSGCLENLMRYIGLRDGTFNTASGNDGNILPALALGVDACVSGNANFAPELITALYHAASSGDMDLARTLQQKVNAIRDMLKDGRDLSLLKGILTKRGLAVGKVRSPLPQASQAEVDMYFERVSGIIRL